MSTEPERILALLMNGETPAEWRALADEIDNLAPWLNISNEAHARMLGRARALRARADAAEGVAAVGPVAAKPTAP